MHYMTGHVRAPKVVPVTRASICVEILFWRQFRVNMRYIEVAHIYYGYGDPGTEFLRVSTTVFCKTIGIFAKSYKVFVKFVQSHVESLFPEILQDSELFYLSTGHLSPSNVL